MWSLFGSELPEALTRTVDIAEMCDLTLPKDVNYLPRFPIPASNSDLSVDQYLRRSSTRASSTAATVWDRQFSRGELQHSLDEYRTRLATEIEMIRQMGFPSYFLIVWDFVLMLRNIQSQWVRAAGQRPAAS